MALCYSWGNGRFSQVCPGDRCCLCQKGSGFWRDEGKHKNDCWFRRTMALWFIYEAQSVSGQQGTGFITHITCSEKIWMLKLVPWGQKIKLFLMFISGQNWNIDGLWQCLPRIFFHSFTLHHHHRCLHLHKVINSSNPPLFFSPPIYFSLSLVWERVE